MKPCVPCVSVRRARRPSPRPARPRTAVRDARPAHALAPVGCLDSGALLQDLVSMAGTLRHHRRIGRHMDPVPHRSHPRCGVCGNSLRTHARFCDACGSPIRARHAGEERKQITVLFADVVESMTLAAMLGSERLREIMYQLLNRSASVVQRYQGTIDKFTGDGLMAFFGAPVALEDHALRACIAALEIQSVVRMLADEVRERDNVELRL